MEGRGALPQDLCILSFYLYLPFGRNMKMARLFASLFISAALMACASNPTLIHTIELTCLDPDATGYATFQSHNQKVVANRFGIFTTHIRTRNEPYTAQTWRLSRSTDGGKTFTTIYEATHATNPPVLETDSRGNLYLVRPDFTDGNAYLYRFLASKDFREPLITPIPQGSAGKYALCLDERRGQLYYFAHNNLFFLIGLDGKVKKSYPLLRPGPDALLQYPHLYLDREGRLHVAWTTQRHGVYLYWDIHHILSPDGGKSWQNMGGQILTPPIPADQTGPALRITLEDEYRVHTWLSSFLVLDGKVHFLYLAQSAPPRQHYVRYDVATGRREVDMQPFFQGETIRLLGLDGFFAARESRRGSALYCVGNDGGHLACLVSYDNGQSWHDYARAQETFTPYAIGGCRTLTRDGYIIGTFTDQAGDPQAPHQKPRVFFFRIKAE